MREVPDGYKRTVVGVIPQDWRVEVLSSVANVKTGPFGSALHERDYVDDGTPIITVEHLSEHGIAHYGLPLVSAEDRSRLGSYELRAGDIVFSRVGSVDRNSLVSKKEDGWLFSGRLLRIRTSDRSVHPPYLSYHFHSEQFKKRIRSVAVGQTMASLNTQILKEVCIVLPIPPEQRAIAEALSDVDSLIKSLDVLIAKKKAIKQATMQQLLTGKTRLPGFSGVWETKRIEEITDCLDHVRIPLNETQRAGMPGHYPYCGANGVLDYVNDFVLDDDVILIAEDGGYFDEYTHRPIAYRMSGKIWVNNHAHILKAKLGYSQGFMYFSLVHKNILPYLASGTRAKLNKSEMNKIEIYLPLDNSEQEAVAAVLSDLETEIASLERRLDKTRSVKQGMMQQLLTGKVRLVKPTGKMENSAC